MHHRLLSKSIIVSLACLLLVASSVAADGVSRTKRRKPVTRFRSEVKLSPPQQVRVPKTKLRIKFIAVENDSRCPADVTCVWAGNAAVKLELSGLGRASVVTLNTSEASQFVRETVYHGYKVTLVNLTPYPRSTQKIAAGDYQATLLVSKR